jgi:hypothetical protein
MSGKKGAGNTPNLPRISMGDIADFCPLGAGELCIYRHVFIAQFVD